MDLKKFTVVLDLLVVFDRLFRVVRLAKTQIDACHSV